MKNFIDFFNKQIRKVNKYYVITIVVFLIVTFFIGDNTYLDGIHYQSKINSLKKEIESLRQDNDEKLRQLNALQGDKESLEQFAREQFRMSKADEDLFLIVD